MNHSVWLLLCCLFSFLLLSSAQKGKPLCELPDGIVAPEEVTIGGMMAIPDFGPEKGSAIRLAVELINKDPCFLPETQLNLVMGWTDGTPTSGLEVFLNVQEEYNPVGWSGFPRSDVSRTVALASPLSETPIVSGTSNLADLSDATIYPYFSRVIASAAAQGVLLADLCNEYGWDRVGVISVSDSFGSSIVEEFTNRAVTYSIELLSTATFPRKGVVSSNDLENQMRSAIRKTLASGARIILLANLPTQQVEYWKIALEEGLIGPPYTYILAEGFLPEQGEFEDENVAEQFQQNVRGMLSFSTQGVQPSEVTDEWVAAWLAADPEVYPGAGDPFWATHRSLALFRDSTYVLAHGIDRLIRRGIDPSDGPALLETIQQETDFLGLTGRVHLKVNGDRDATHDIVNTRDFDFDLTVIGYANNNSLVLTKEAIFPDGTTDIPDAAEQIYVHWGDAEAMAMVALFSLVLLVTVGCLIVLGANRNTPVMTYSSPRFVFGLTLGVLVGLTNVFLWTGKPTSSVCQARPWLLVFNFALIFGFLFAKSFRFLSVMRQRKTLQLQPIPDLRLFLSVFSYLLLFLIPLIVWTAAFPSDVKRSDNNPDNDKVNIICNSDNSDAFLGVLLAFGAISLVVGVVVAFLNRNYHDFFSEASYIGYTMFTVCVTCCVVLPMLFILNDNPHAFYIVLMLGVLFGNLAVLVFMFFPKVYLIFHPERNVVPLDNNKTKKPTSPTPTVFSKRPSFKSSKSSKSTITTPPPPPPEV